MASPRNWTGGSMVFISYSSAESDRASSVKALLEGNGFPCWMAPESIPAGLDYGGVILGAVRGCDAFVLLLSEKSQGSKWIRKELDTLQTEPRYWIP